MIDTHAHMDWIEGAPEALRRAWQAGLHQVTAVAMDRASGLRALELARADRRVWPALGLHPWQVAEDTWQGEVRFVAENLHLAVALGEVGLDYKKKTPHGLQKRALAAQLELAADAGLTALVHCRFSEHRVLTMLGDHGVTGVFHWFAGGSRMLRDVLEAGHYISATPSVATSPPHRQAVLACPLERLVLETDAPVAHGGRPSQPADVVITCRLVAELKGLDMAEVERVTDANARRLLRPPASGA